MALPIRRSLAWSLALSALGTSAAAASQLAVLSRPGTSGPESILVLPTPHAGLPAPDMLEVAGLPDFAGPHGLSFADSDTVLVADFLNFRLLVVNVASRQLEAVIPIGDPGEQGSADGTGTLAVDPSGRYALVLGDLACFETGYLTVVHAPFHAGSTVTRTPLPWGCGMEEWVTQGIVFDRERRAYIWGRSSIRVFEPPYIAEFLGVNQLNNSGGAIAITPDDNQLLTTDVSTSGQVGIWSLPLAGASQPQMLDIAPGVVLYAIGVSPDGMRALVAAGDVARLFSITAPFGPSSSVEEIPLPAGFSGRGFEDITFRPDGGLAIATGNAHPSGPQPLLVLEPPFTAAGAQVHAVVVPGADGRGNGAARFWPGLFADGFESGDTSAWSAP